MNNKPKNITNHNNKNKNLGKDNPKNQIKFPKCGLILKLIIQTGWPMRLRKKE